MMKQFILLPFFFIIFYSEIESQVNNANLPKPKLLEIKNYLKEKNYNQNLAVFINFKTHLRKYRYFVYDLKNERIPQRTVVSHGSGCVTPNPDALTFSNIEGSYQTSLGKYEIRESYMGKFGKSDHLYGLDSTNSNAMQRVIVLHSYVCAPDKEPQSLACLSLGCPILSVNAFNQTAKFVDQSEQPVILYAFY